MIPNVASTIMVIKNFETLDVTTSGELGLPAKQSVPFEESVSDTGASAHQHTVVV